MKQQKTVLRKIRRDREWSIDWVCLKTGIDHATFSQVERRLKSPSFAVQRKLEKFFKLPADQLLADAPEETAA